MTIKRTKIAEKTWTPEKRCEYLAPYICFQNQQTHIWQLIQACCNHWDCPRCGEMRAKEEYARIVEGARAIDLQGHQLYFWTLTCRGKEITSAEAEAGYLKWTHRLLRTATDKARRAAEFWCYVQVTERQKRGHPHSHLISTYCPSDVIPYAKGDLLPNGRKARHACLWSEWFRAANVRAGLGVECDLSAVKSAEAVGRYVAKYMFKATAVDRWPPGWKRVRYSQNWPQLPDETNLTGFPVIQAMDWHRVWDLKEPVRADSQYTYAAACARGVDNVLPPSWT